MEFFGKVATLKRFYLVPFTPVYAEWTRLGQSWDQERPSFGTVFLWLLPLLALLLDHPGLVPGVASMSKPATLRQIHQQLANAISDLRKAGLTVPTIPQGRAALSKKGQNVHDHQAAARRRVPSRSW
jgi:hypothetical protein